MNLSVYGLKEKEMKKSINIFMENDLNVLLLTYSHCSSENFMKLDTLHYALLEFSFFVLNDFLKS